MENIVILELLRECLGIDSLELNSKFPKDELDSIIKVHLVVCLEDYLQKEISIVELFSCNNINEIVAFVLREKGKRDE